MSINLNSLNVEGSEDLPNRVIYEQYHWDNASDRMGWRVFYVCLTRGDALGKKPMDAHFAETIKSAAAHGAFTIDKYELLEWGYEHVKMQNRNGGITWTSAKQSFYSVIPNLNPPNF
ncbi:hypothetical protein ACFE04_000702 [Oxalis oulophora]